MHFKLKKIALIVSVLFISVILSITITGCASNQNNTGEEDAQSLVIGSPWTPKVLDTVKAGYLPLRIGMVDTLVSVNYDAEISPGLAESWKVSGNGLEWTFKLKEGVKFHDGTPCDAEAVKWSLERVLQKGTLLKDVPLKAIEVKDENTLVITTKEPFAPLPAYLAKGEAAPISKNSLNEKGELEKLIGTGPFKFDSWIPNQEVTLVKNKEYWGEVPQLDKVVYKGIPETATRMMMLKSGELDMARLLPADAVEQLKSNTEIKVLTSPILRTRTVIFNLLKEPFNDLKVRKAVNYAIDRKAIVEHIMAGVDMPAKGAFPPTSPWANKDIEGYPYNLEKARQLLAEAGWKDTDNDGILDKNGKPLKIDLITYTERASLPPTAEVMQEQLKKVGIQINLRISEWGGCEAASEKGDFDMFLLARNLGFLPDPSYYLMSDYHSSNTGKGSGAYGYNNKRVDELVEQAQVTMDLQKRHNLYNEVQEIIVDETPVIFLNHYVNVIAVQSNVHGYKVHPTESCFHLENVYFK